MKRSFIEEFEHQSKLGPAPDSYAEGPKFGQLGTKPAMRGRLTRYGMRSDDYSDFYRTQQKSLPGPGYYKEMEVTGTKVIESSIRT